MVLCVDNRWWLDQQCSHALSILDTYVLDTNLSDYLTTKQVIQHAPSSKEALVLIPSKWTMDELVAQGARPVYALVVYTPVWTVGSSSSKHHTYALTLHTATKEESCRRMPTPSHHITSSPQQFSVHNHYHHQHHQLT
jgi:hypothetical protein